MGGGGRGSWPLRRPKKILRIRESLTLQNAIPESGFWCQNPHTLRIKANVMQNKHFDGYFKGKSDWKYLILMLILRAK